MVAIVALWRRRRLPSRPLTVELTARQSPDWGAIEVRRPMDRTNEGPYMGRPTQ
ncbi:MAG: hypothetical protein M3281_04640 [Chloroflexota bacterium]|nr:hypothetical protein [Chloroflexota bacterium]